ncbi:hypothetical protein D3C80_1597980 [compost metagenome]
MKMAHSNQQIPINIIHTKCIHGPWISYHSPVVSETKRNSSTRLMVAITDNSLCIHTTFNQATHHQISKQILPNLPYKGHITTQYA